MQNDFEHLAFVEINSIQPYIFGSNRLRENIGASHLVYTATAKDGWAGEIAKDNKVGKIYIEGAGNFMARFPSRPDAEAFVRQLSRKVLIAAPGLQIAASVEPSDADLSVVQARGVMALDAQKRERPPAIGAPGFSVTRECETTGLPAVEFVIRDAQETPLALSAKSYACWNMKDAAQKRLETVIPPPAGFLYPEEFNKLGANKGSENYIAVVHADGNGIGKRFKAWIEGGNDPQELSSALAKASQAALQYTIDHLTQAIGDNLDMVQTWGETRALRIKLD